MIQTLFLLPVPSTALLHEKQFQVLPKRTCSLSLEYEDEGDDVTLLKLLFSEVEAFKCTYISACPADVIKAAYDKVVDLGVTEWFSGITEQISGNSLVVPELHHLAAYFDDGPLYEFICKEFRVEKLSR